MKITPETRAKMSAYKGIMLWGMQLGSLPYYIEGEQLKAVQDNAPGDALYHYRDANKWWCVSDLHAGHNFIPSYQDFIQLKETS